MSAPVESIDVRVSDALVTALAAIVSDAGVTYWYTPEKVVRHHDFNNQQCLDDSLATFYVLVPDHIEREKLGNKRISTAAFFDLVQARRMAGQDHPFVPPDPTRVVAQARLAKDAAKKLLGGDMTLGLAGTSGVSVYDVAIPFVEYGPEQTFVEAWALVVNRLVVKYMHMRTEA